MSNDLGLDVLTPDEVSQYKYEALRKADTEGRMSVPIVAKGDSWFDFLPGTDVIDCLRSRHGMRIVNFAKAGDTLENMILGNSTDEEGRPLPPGISRPLAEVKRAKPRYFLFSGGGNDIAGEEFRTYLNHAKSGHEVLRKGLISEMIDLVFYSYLKILVKEVEIACDDTLIVMHGYGHTVPTGIGTGFFGFTFAGPWLLPALRMKSISLDEGRAAVREIIDVYNNMLKRVEQESGGRFIFIDLRGILGQEDWRDELHLRNSAYARVSDHMAKFLK